MAGHRAAVCQSQDSSSGTSSFSSLAFSTAPQYRQVCKACSSLPFLPLLLSSLQDLRGNIDSCSIGVRRGPSDPTVHAEGSLNRKLQGVRLVLCWLCGRIGLDVHTEPEPAHFSKDLTFSILQGLQRVPCAIKLSLETSIKKSRRKLSINAFTRKHHT